MLSEKEFGKIYEEYADKIFRHCFFRVFNRRRAQELMQDTFLHAWQYNIKGEEIRNVRAFLYRIANNLVIDESRKKKDLLWEDIKVNKNNNDQDEIEFDPGEDNREELQDQIDGRLAMETLNELEQNHREVIVMRYIDDLYPKEIAELTGESANVISVRINRALKELRKKIQKNV